MLAIDQNQDVKDASPASVAFLSMRDDVFSYWQREVRLRVAGASELREQLLLNNLPIFYDDIGDSLTAGYTRASGANDATAAAEHGAERARATPLGADQVVLEYQIFHEAILAVASGRFAFSENERRILDAAVNSAIVEAVKVYLSIQDQIRARFAAALSHDMRNPLTLVDASAQLVGLAPDMETGRRAAKRIEVGAMRLVAMTDELLDALTYKRGSRLPLVISGFDMGQLVAEVAAERVAAQGAQTAVAATAIRGYWCRSTMKRALENLVANAKKYGDGGPILIAAIQKEERLILTVHNTGSHIPAAQRSSIFDYLRRESSSDSQPGWGIGLEFVRLVAENHGGAASVVSSKTDGTTFIIDIPLDARPFANGSAEAHGYAVKSVGEPSSKAS